QRAISAGLERDFNTGDSDIFGLVLDTFLDRRNSFLFLVNPKGAVRDEQTFNDSRTIVEAWDGISRVKTTQQDSSWTVEMVIPLRTLRFDASRDPQNWGINFIRRVRRVNETSYWAPLERQYRLHRMSKAGTVEGLTGLKQGRNLQVKPYVLGGNSQGAQVPKSSLGNRSDIGGDLKYGVTPSLTLDLTYNTDFSQVEVDQQVVNLTRFGILFPERREFFIENSGVFTFGDVQERNYRMGADLRDFTLFNSRQIGLTPDGLPLPIAGGGRLTGRVGKWEVGALNMQTQHGAGSAPAENFGVARLRRNVFGNSDVGILAANRQATDGSGAYNRTYGVDANI
ncbi:MAG: hydrolase, partial [Gemmatimonadaceae bacterium]|nr:hydrolase [Gemmatimonadaceae bacterium]